ncbi:MAG: hypothetical protein ACXWEA_04885 [Solirubrobacterales bacterium]
MPAAHASFHLVKISEIGVEAGLDGGYLELQMYAPGQNLMSGHHVTIWDDDGLAPPMALPGPIAELTLSVGNPENAESQRTVLIGDVGVAGRDYTLDFTPYWNPMVTNNVIDAGAVCFEAIDCISWGGDEFTGEAHIPDGTAPLSGSVAGLGLTAHHRTLARGCATAMDIADDTNDAAADFSSRTPSPRPNSAAPTETLCGGQQGEKPPLAGKKKCKKPKKKAEKGDAAAAKKKKCKKKKPKK